MSFVDRGFVWRNDVTLFKNTTPPIKTRGFFVVRKDIMSEVLSKGYYEAEMLRIASLTGKDVTELSQSSAAELRDLYDTPEVARVYGYEDYLVIVAASQFYKSPRQ